MTTREAVRVLNKPGRSAYYGTEVWDSISAILRALARPTRLEREAARILRQELDECPMTRADQDELDADECAWLARYERKAKR